MHFIHISNRLAVNHKKSDWPLGSATYQKKLAPKNPEKYSLSNFYYDFYSYLKAFGHNQQMSDFNPLHSVPSLPLPNAFHEFPYLERETNNN